MSLSLRRCKFVLGAAVKKIALTHVANSVISARAAIKESYPNGDFARGVMDRDSFHKALVNQLKSTITLGADIAMADLLGLCITVPGVIVRLNNPGISDHFPKSVANVVGRLIRISGVIAHGANKAWQFIETL